MSKFAAVAWILNLILAACGDQASNKPINANYIVVFESLGSAPPGYVFSVNEITLSISGCQNLANAEQVINPTINKNILNLYKDDVGCLAKIASFSGSVNGEVHSFSLVSQNETDNKSLFCYGKFCVELSLVQQFSSPLAEQGQLTFRLLPFVDGDSMLQEKGVIPAEATAWPRLIPLNLTLIKPGDAGKSVFGVLFSCELPLEFWVCNNISLKDFALEVVPWPTPFWTNEEFLSHTLPQGNEVLYANESHFFANGARMTFEVAEGTTNFLVMVRAQNVVRYFKMTL